MNWFSRFMLANWSYVFDALLLTMALLFGVHLGESRIQKAWDAEKLKIAQVEAKQEQHVEDVKHVQTQINQEITSGFLKNPNFWLIACLTLTLSGCAISPHPVAGVCPPFPQLPPELLQPAPTLYLLPKEMQGG